ncbi:MAG: hypothetical protein KGR19_07140 [Acidobacteria bacterium]|nr:hypothetical protein [Acidobacteriota bacterium]
MTRIGNRTTLAALLLAIAALAIGAGSASANSSYWGDNGSDTCTYAESFWKVSGELGTYCMQSVTGWISIGGGATQNQAISCSNNAPGGSPGLSWSLDGQSYDNAGPWPAVGIIGTNPLTFGPATVAGWQTGDGGDASLSAETWYGGVNIGNPATDSYGSAGASVTNFGGGGNWQAALACVNTAGASADDENAYTSQSRRTELGTRPMAQLAGSTVRIRDKKIDAIDRVRGRAFLAREYALNKNVTRTDTRTCPAGMVRRGSLAYTVQEFPADHKAPKWKDRSLVRVKLTNRGKNAGSVKMTLTRAKNPTVVQFQMRCGKR